MSDQCSLNESDQAAGSPNYGFFYWSTVWLGITVGGGLGGTMAGGIEGILFGIIFTGIAAMVVCPVGSILTHIIRPKRIPPILIALVGSISGMALPLTGAIYFSCPEFFAVGIPICILTGACGGATATILNSTSARWNSSRKSNTKWSNLLIVILVGGLLSLISIPCLLGQEDQVWRIVEQCLCTLGSPLWLLIIIPLLFAAVFYTTAVACRCRPIVRWAWIVVGVMFLLSIFSPPVKYLITVQHFRHEHDAVRSQLKSIEKQKPKSVDADQWESAIGWTHNLMCNVYFSPNEKQLASLRRLNRDMKKKCEEPVNLSMLRWIWDTVEADNPGNTYAVRFWDDRVFAEKPIDDDSLPGLRSLDKRSWLNLYDLNITDAGLVHLVDLPLLTWLGLKNTHITDDGVKILAKMKNLETLNLEGTKVTQDGVDYLKKELPKCKIEY